MMSRYLAPPVSGTVDPEAWKEHVSQPLMDAFDRLGPLARQAINDSPIDISPTAVLKMFNRPMVFAGKLKSVSLDDPAVDRMVAEYIAKRIREKMGRDPAVYVLRADRQRRPMIRARAKRHPLAG